MSETQSYSSMTRAQRDMAIAIAEDVIAQLQRTDGLAMRIESASGYLDGDLPEDAAADPDRDLSAHVDVVQANCKVCMLGACLLSKARLFDAVPVSAFLWRDDVNCIYGSRGTVTEHLGTVFDDDTMFDLEDAFEDGGRGTDAERAIAIAENLIRNDGVFEMSEFDDKFGNPDDEEDDDLDDDEEEDDDFDDDPDDDDLDEDEE